MVWECCSCYPRMVEGMCSTGNSCADLVGPGAYLDIQLVRPSDTAREPSEKDVHTSNLDQDDHAAPSHQRLVFFPRSPPRRPYIARSMPHMHMLCTPSAHQQRNLCLIDRNATTICAGISHLLAVSSTAQKVSLQD